MRKYRYSRDEMNLTVAQDSMVESELVNLALTTNHIMDQANGVPNIYIVQDSLASAYLLTQTVTPLSRGLFMDLSMCGANHDGTPLYTTQKIAKISEVLTKFGKDPNPYTGHGLISLLLPENAFYENKNGKNPNFPTVKIYNGVFYEGTLSKAILGARQNSLIQYLHFRFGIDVTRAFIDNIQFIMVSWIKKRGFSIGIGDALPNSALTAKIDDMVYKAYTSADIIDETTSDPFMREVKISGALARVRDASLKGASELMITTNSLRTTIEAGSKGDYFNSAQLTGLLGQQLLSGGRILHHTVHFNSPTLTQVDKYKSKGFVTSSFGSGLDPHEFFAHAMAGREGITETAVKTGESGYAQRRMVKALEDVIVNYNLSNRLQLCYGECGLNPSRCFLLDGVQQFCNVYRLVDEFNARVDGRVKGSTSAQQLSIDQIESVLGFIKPQHGIPKKTALSVVEIVKAPLRVQLSRIRIDPVHIPELIREIQRSYYRALIEPGEAVGIIAAQQMGSTYTQQSLDSFQKAGANDGDSNPMDQILNCSKSGKNAKTIIYPSRSMSIRELRESFNKLTELKLSAIASSIHLVEKEEEPEWYSVFEMVYDSSFRELEAESHAYVRVKLNMYALCWYFLTIEEIVKKIESAYDVKCVFSPDSIGEIHIYISLDNMDDRPEKYDESVTDENFIRLYLEKMAKMLENVYISGIPFLSDIQYVRDSSNAWYMVVSGSNYKKVLDLDGIDLYRTTTTDIWELYDILGIEGVRQHIISELGKDNGINSSHIKIIADHICHTGSLVAINRYGNRQASSGVLTRASYEETCKTIIDGASYQEVETPGANVSSAIICGIGPRVGSNFTFEMIYKP